MAPTRDQYRSGDLHTRRAVLSAKVLLPMFFLFGFIAATGLPLWVRNRTAAILVLSLPVVIGVWLWVTYSRTGGWMEEMDTPRGNISHPE